MSARRRVDRRPSRRSYAPELKAVPITALPFVRTSVGPARERGWWVVPPVPNTARGYTDAVNLGRDYAAHFAQYLKDNPDEAGANWLGVIAGSIEFSCTSAAQGYWVGFFSHLERYILATAYRVDLFADVDRVIAESERIVSGVGKRPA